MDPGQSEASLAEFSSNMLVVTEEISLADQYVMNGEMPENKTEDDDTDGWLLEWFYLLSKSPRPQKEGTKLH